MNCPYCGSSNTMKYFEAKIPNILSAYPESMKSYVETFTFVARLCKDCLLGYNAAKLDDEQLKVIYDNYIYISPLQGIGVSKYEGMIKTLKQYYSREDKIVEIGCSEGYLLKQLKDAGYSNLTGIEPGPQADEARALGLNIIKAYFDDTMFKDDLFDGFYLMHVFEHFGDPFAILEQMAKKLSPSGKIIIEVPYFCGYHHQHLFFYNHSFLKRLCDDKGLKIVDKIIAMDAIRIVLTHKNNQEYIEVENTEGSDGIIELSQSLFENFNSKVSKLNRLLENYSGKKVYWWGAGSATVININQVSKELIDNIDITVVDSDKNKIGYYIPGFNLRVNSYELIKNTEADLIIIASSFYTEIMHKLEENGITAKSIEVVV